MSEQQPRGMTRRQAMATMAGTAGVAALGSPLMAPAAHAAGPRFWYQESHMGTSGGLPPDFFSRYDDLSTWQDARSAMHNYMMRQNSYAAQLHTNPEFLQKMAAAHTGINLSFNVLQATAWWWQHYKDTGEIPPGPPDYTRTLLHLRRLRDSGFRITDIMLQSVLAKPGPGGFRGYGMDLRIRDVVEFFRQVKPEFPTVRIGILDPMTSSYMPWNEAYDWLQDEVTAAGYHWDFLHFDKPFDRPRNGVTNEWGLTWTWDQFVVVQDYVQQNLGITFGLNCSDLEGGSLGDDQWRQFILDGVASFVEAGGHADRYILTAFGAHPDSTVPDTLGALPPEGAAALRIYRELMTSAAAG